MNINFELKADLLSRGFIVANENCHIMEYAMGSIAHYTKCTISLGHRHWGDIAEQWFYWVRYEAFAESGQPEFDHHTITESYIAESNVVDFLKSKGIYTEAERAEHVEQMRRVIRERREKRLRG